MFEQLATVAAPAALLIGIAGVVGALASDLWLLPATPQSTGSTALATVRNHLWAALGACLIVIALAMSAEVLLRAADMSGQPLADAIAVVPTVLLQTHYGTLWLWRAGALLTLALVWLVRRQRPQWRTAAALGFAAAVVMIVALSTSGHAGDDGFLSLTNALNTAHLLGGFLWGGGILAATLVVLRTLVPEEAAVRAAIAESSARLSVLSTLALAMVLLPGIWNAWQLLGRWTALWKSPYGQLLSAKILLVLGMMALGAINRFILVPRIELWAGRRAAAPFLADLIRRGANSNSVSDFQGSLRIEATLLLAVLVLAGALAQQTPAVHETHEEAMHEHTHATDPTQ